MIKTKKMHRWQGFALAALVMASGLTVVPQAADAATVTSKSTICRAFTESCTLTVKSRNDVHFRVGSNWTGTVRYTVRTPTGRLLCRGTIGLNHGNRGCWFGTYTGPVRVTVSKDWMSFVRIYASY